MSSSVTIYFYIFYRKALPNHFTLFLQNTYFACVFTIMGIVYTRFSWNLVRATLSLHFRNPLILPNPSMIFRQSLGCTFFVNLRSSHSYESPSTIILLQPRACSYINKEKWLKISNFKFSRNWVKLLRSISAEKIILGNFPLTGVLGIEQSTYKKS